MDKYYLFDDKICNNGVAMGNRSVVDSLNHLFKENQYLHKSISEQHNKIVDLETKLAEKTEQLKIALKDFNDIQEENDKLAQQLAEERKKVVSELKVDIRSLFNSYASSLIDYCIWNKNADENQKLYNNFKRIINDRLVNVLDLFDKRIDQIERGTDD